MGAHVPRLAKVTCTNFGRVQFSMCPQIITGLFFLIYKFKWFSSYYLHLPLGGSEPPKLALLSSILSGCAPSTVSSGA